MPSNYYYTRNNQTMGPVSSKDLRQLASLGYLKPTDMVMKEGYKWKPAGEIPGLFGTAPPPPGAAAASPAPAAANVPCWYYALDGQPLGPCTAEQIKSLIKVGDLGAEDSVWREGMAEWLPLAQVPEFSKRSKKGR
jgi:uncharacterized protein DUF4339